MIHKPSFRCGFRHILGLAALLFASFGSAPTVRADLAGPQKVIVPRVYFNDYPAASRYTRGEVQSFFDNEMNGLWEDISYGTISIDATVTDLLQLPGVRTDYVTDGAGGEDSSDGGQFLRAVRDSFDLAVAAGVDFAGAAAVLVVMSETDPGQFHLGEGTKCNLPIGPGGADVLIGCGIVSENPIDSDRSIWGRWAHEIGHTFQEVMTLHPSNYNSHFELLDSLYPGQSGVFLKHRQEAGFPGWMPVEQYAVLTPAGGGGTAYVAAEEIPPPDVEALPPVGVDKAQAAKAELTPDLYYLASVRKRLNGDEIVPIPDEGVLIERVVIGGDPAFDDCSGDGEFCPRWVNLQGVGGDRDVLWKTGLYTNATDGVNIQVAEVAGSGQSVYQVSVFFDPAADMPDVMINPWLTPPEANYETPDIWIDSSCNGYDTYQYGTITPSGDATPVGAGNGDNPCANVVNRIYARVRNIGGAAATNVVVHFDVTDPLGLGINGANGFVEIGSVDRIDFPELAIINAGEYVDVFLPWTPAVPPEDLEEGAFDFHSCLRVRIDPVANETNTANQDGHAEQENIAQFYTSPDNAGLSIQAGTAAAGVPIELVVHLRNDSEASRRSFNLFWDSNLPPQWALTVNGGVRVVELDPGEVVDVPVSIVPEGVRLAGQRYWVHVGAESLRFLINDKDPADKHPDFIPLAGVTLEVRVADPSSLRVKVRQDGTGIHAEGSLTPVPVTEARILLRLTDVARRSLASQVVQADTLGKFSWVFPLSPGARFLEAIFVGGEFQQPATSVAEIPEVNIPTLTDWGLVLLTLLMTVAGFTLLKRRRSA